MRCSTCGEENHDGRKFCGECGAAPAVTCLECGIGNPPGVKFCGECGSPLGGLAAPAPAVAQGRADETEPLLDEAREIFERLGATPWLERTGGARTVVEVGA